MQAYMRRWNKETVLQRAIHQGAHAGKFAHSGGKADHFVAGNAAHHAIPLGIDDLDLHPLLKNTESDADVIHLQALVGLVHNLGEV